MNISFEAFEHEAKANGADEVLARHWQPNQVVADHSHPFDANALVVAGEMWLTVGSETQHIATGGRFSLPAGTVHSERYGPDGATYWVGRKNV